MTEMTQALVDAKKGMSDKERELFDRSISGVLAETISMTAQRAKGQVQEDIADQYLVPMAKEMMANQGKPEQIRRIKQKYANAGLHSEQYDVAQVVQDLQSGKLSESVE